ncbi:MAG: GTP 3',8-cyclase MoaA [Pseudomonadota bacterium]|nr:GTP 3',8-cyclase MoaA [Pseudomonadota bacterium]
MNVLNDSIGRKVSYLRISVTDRCNLRCRYCTPEEQFPFLNHQDVLRYEEILTVIRALVPVGIDKVRLTGGEPLVRKNLDQLIGWINDINGIRDISLTTNGVLLAEKGKLLRDAGLSRINISLDSLKPDKFFYITRRNYFPQVMNGIETALSLGFSPVKINVVAMRGFNDDEIIDFAALAERLPVHVRFIEYMPIGSDSDWQADQFIPVHEIRRQIEEVYGPLSPLPTDDLAGPAKVFFLPGGQGRIGFIGVLSNPFCDRCNRVRLTADGRLRPCLLADIEFDLKNLLRHGTDADAIRALFFKALAEKPESHGMSCNTVKKCVRVMSSIGG